MIAVFGAMGSGGLRGVLGRASHALTATGGEEGDRSLSNAFDCLSNAFDCLSNAFDCLMSIDDCLSSASGCLISIDDSLRNASDC
jgi:hypothetical protein